MIGDFLYRLTAKDIQSAPVMQRLVLVASLSQAAAVVAQQTAAIPADKIARVSHISISADPGAAQTCRTLVLSLRQPDGSFFANVMVINPDPAIAADILVGGSMQTDFIMWPGELLQITGFFNAGAAANDVNLHVHVTLLPKGNLQIR